VLLVADGEEHSYQLDLRGNPAWVGRVEALQLAAARGQTRIHELAAEVPGSALREIEIAGLLLPALAGGGRVELVLPPTMPRRATFETYLGVLSVSDSSDAVVDFRAWSESGNRRTAWLEEEVSAADGWTLKRRPVEIPRGSRLILETTVRGRREDAGSRLAFWGAPRCIADQRTPGPNLLVIAIDTLRADALGSYGGEGGWTPAIDRLSLRSVRFADLTAPAPWTLPSFATLLTGLQPQTHGAGRNLTGSSFLRDAPITPLDRRVKTLAGVLANAGFHTAGLYVNPFLGPAFGLHRSFDEYRGFEATQRAEPVIDGAIEVLERVRDRRFFLFVHLFDPHTPYRPTEPFCREVARRLEPSADAAWPCRAVRNPQREEIPPARRAWARALYQAEVAYTDRQVGHLLASLGELGLDDRTAVLLVSDHGEEFWEHQEQEERYGYHFPGDHGHSHYRELLHVPGLLFLPGGEPRVIAAPVEMVDLFPTLLGYLGVQPPPNQGRDLRPLLSGHELPEPLRISDYLLYGDARWSARSGPWKLVERSGDEPIAELYNLEEDPVETRNRSRERGDVVKTLRSAALAEIAARVAERPAADVTQPVQLDEEQRERLRSLGYLQ
jgi:arylsulfatase A-like enzyme